MHSNIAAIGQSQHTHTHTRFRTNARILSKIPVRAPVTITYVRALWSLNPGGQHNTNRIGYLRCIRAPLFAIRGGGGYSNALCTFAMLIGGTVRL